MSAPKAKEKKSASAWTPPAWGEQADGYKATMRNHPGFSKGDSKKKGSFLAKQGYTGSMYEESLARKYCISFNTVSQFYQPGSGCNKKHVPLYCLKQYEKAIQYAHVKNNKINIVINGIRVRDVPDDMKDLA